MHTNSEMRLYSPKGRRLYLNAGERARFLEAALKQPIELRLFCLVLFYTGCRISEALALRQEDFQIESQTVSIVCLKKRRPGIVRELPVPPIIFSHLNQMPPTSERLWSWHRSTAWRKIRTIMSRAQIGGAQATAKGLRHSFGVHAVQCTIPPQMLAKWLGHSSLKTTAIYSTPVGPDERVIASRMWERVAKRNRCYSVENT